MDKRLKEKHDKRYKNEVFHKDNIVLVQLWTVRGRRRSPRKRFIIEGKIIDKNLKSNSYKISLTCPGETQQTILWVTIDDLTIAKKQEKAPKKQNRSYYISLAKTDRLENLTNQEFSVIYDPPRDGSCQFYALAYFLCASGYSCDASSLRSQVADYLENHSANKRSQPYELFAAILWDQYLTEMSQDEIYGNKITLQAIVHLYNIHLYRH